MSTIKVTVYSTRGQRKSIIETAVTTWGELRELVSSAGYDLQKLVGTDSINKQVFGLDTLDATVIPSQDFTLFLRPTQTKSGMGRDVENASWISLRGTMNRDIEEHEEEASEYYNSHFSGKNYTQLTTNELRSMVRDFPDFLAAQNEPEEEEYEDNAPDCEDMDVECDRNDAEALSVAKSLIGQVANNVDNEDAQDMCNEITNLIDAVQSELGTSDVVDSETARLEAEARALFGNKM
jgi:hypothetical protein